MLTLDMDYATTDIWDEIIMLHDFKCCVYSTHKHTPEAPRLRLVIPLSREVSEDEYPALGRMVAKEIGINLFDDTTYEACRLMYWPSTPANGEFLFQRERRRPARPGCISFKIRRLAGRLHMAGIITAVGSSCEKASRSRQIL